MLNESDSSEIREFVLDRTSIWPALTKLILL